MRVIYLNEKYLNEIIEIEQKSFSLPWTEGMFAAEFEKDFAYYLGIEEEGRLIAYGGFWKIFDEAHITNVAVEPNYRNRGVGKLLIDELLKLCKELLLKKVTLEVRISNLVAISLYERAGFKAHGRRKEYYEDNKEDALIMWLNF